MWGDAVARYSCQTLLLLFIEYLVLVTKIYLLPLGDVPFPCS